MALGRPIPPLQLSREERETLERWVRRPSSAQALLGPHRAGLCARRKQHPGGATHAREQTYGGQMAWPVRGAAPRWPARRTAPGSTAPDQRRCGGARADVDSGKASAGRHPLVHPLHGPAQRLEPERGEPHLACVCFPTAPAETFQLSKDPLFIEKVRDIVGLYLHPPDQALVLCADEKTQSRRWTVRSHCCPCVRGRPSGARMITCGMAPPRCSRPWK